MGRTQACPVHSPTDCLVVVPETPLRQTYFRSGSRDHDAAHVQGTLRLPLYADTLAPLFDCSNPSIIGQDRITRLLPVRYLDTIRIHLSPQPRQSSAQKSDS